MFGNYQFPVQEKHLNIYVSTTYNAKNTQCVPNILKQLNISKNMHSMQKYFKLSYLASKEAQDDNICFIINGIVDDNPKVNSIFLNNGNFHFLLHSLILCKTTLSEMFFKKCTYHKLWMTWEIN